MSERLVYQIKREIRLLDLLQEYGIDLDSRGKGRCPFFGRHKNGDIHPSLYLDSRTGRLYCNSVRCFDLSGRRGVDVIGFVMAMEGCDFKTAIRRLQSRCELVR